MPPPWTYEQQLQLVKQYCETFRSIPPPYEFWTILKASWERQWEGGAVTAVEEELLMKEVCSL